MIKYHVLPLPGEEIFIFGVKGGSNAIGSKCRRCVAILLRNISFAWITLALRNVQDRKIFLEQKEVSAELAHVGNFEKEKDWEKRHDSFINYIIIIPRNTRIFLILLHPRPRPRHDYSHYATSNIQLIEQASLIGRVFVYDRYAIFQILTSFTTTTPLVEWIKSSNP